MDRRRERRHIKADINIVPLLDVLLVLVLIFISTAPIFTQSVEVALPDADATDFKTVGHDDNLPIILEVYGINQYRLLFENQRWEQLLTEQVILGARAHMNTNPKKVFLIGGAKNVPYNEIIKVLNFLHQAGVKSVGLMTHPI